MKFTWITTLIILLVIPSVQLMSQENKEGVKAIPDTSEAVFAVVETMPGFTGGEEARAKFISSNLHYPDSAVKAGIDGIVYLNFVVEKDGSLTHATVVRGIGSGCDEEALRVIKLMPPWNPGTQAGKAVRVQYTLPVRFKLVEPEPLYTIVREMPSFPGGEEERLAFLWKNIQMPVKAARNNISGTVYVSFVVNSTGKLSNISIFKGIGYGCDEEVLRVIHLMPSWNPGKQDGNPVSVQFTMPIRFTNN